MTNTTDITKLNEAERVGTHCGLNYAWGYADALGVDPGDGAMQFARVWGWICKQEVEGEITGRMSIQWSYREWVERQAIRVSVRGGGRYQVVIDACGPYLVAE